MTLFTGEFTQGQWNVIGLRKFMVMVIIDGKVEELGKIYAIDESAAIKGVLSDCPVLVEKMVISGYVIEEGCDKKLLDKNTSFVASPGYVDGLLCWIYSVVKTQSVKVGTVGCSNTHSRDLVYRQVMHLVSLGTHKRAGEE